MKNALNPGESFSQLNKDKQKLPFKKSYAVDQNWVWKKNVHIAFIHKEGSQIKIDNEYVSCLIENAQSIEIKKDSIDYSLPQSSNKYYNTCRNWWFANQIVTDFQSDQVKPKMGSLFD